MELANHQIEEVYLNLIKASGQRDACPHIQVVEENIVNAYTTTDGIFLFRGLLDKLENLDQLALVMGHEMAHYLLGHCTSKMLATKQRTRIQELQADKYGGMLMMRAGYNICKGRMMLKIFSDLYGDGMDDDHPDNAFRFEQLNISCDGPF